MNEIPIPDDMGNDDQEGNAVDRALQAARELRPDLWERTDQIARIIEPSAFMDDWLVHPEDQKHILEKRLAVQQAAAMRKAQEILQYLGVNTETDWYAILQHLADKKK